MKKILLLLMFIQYSLVQYGQIIADHTVVGKYNDIPQYYIDEVKKMWLVYAGESHSGAIRNGLTLLENSNATYSVSITESGIPEAYTTSNLRASRGTWGDFSNASGWVYDYGEEDWWTNPTAVSRTKAGISYCNSNSLIIGALGFGWCWDAYYPDNKSIGTDPITGNHWYGWSIGSTSGDKGWGIDDADNGVSGNVVNMDDYISVTQSYIDYCTTNGIPTKVFFTTGPVDNIEGYAPNEAMYQGTLKYQRIRDYVLADPALILFDFADILCYDNDGTPTTATWNGHTYPTITSSNLSPIVPAYHISQAGALRLAKAMWWLLARIAGWDGVTSSVPVTGITVTGAGGSTTITTDNGTLQLTATIAPTTATNQTVTWTIANGTGQATISSTGLVTAVSNGTVTARATANDGSGIFGTVVITISSQVIPVTGIAVTGAGGSSLITTDNGTLQLTAAVSPANATNQTVTWSISNGTGQATISATGLVTAVSNGTVTARATANDGSGIFGTLVITISSQVIPVTGIAVTGAGGSSLITTDNGTLQLTAAIAPTNATNPAVTWTISNGTGQATISSTGLVTAVSNGTVTARATANDGSGIYGTLVITISSQVIPVTGVTVTGAGGSTTITTDNGTLQLTAAVSPANATNQTVTWSMANSTGQATISATGLVTAVSNGTVTARATANDGSGIYGTLVITINNQVILITRITLASAKGEAIITTDNGTLQLSTSIAPATASNQTVTWSIVNNTGQASIDSRGLVTAIANGIVTARATANDGSGIFGELAITISNQFVAVAGITVTGAGGATTIDTNDGTLQMIATILPANATDKSVTWSLADGNGHAEISPAGLVTAKSNGKVTVRASANDGSGFFGDIEIGLSNQIVQVSDIKIKSSKNSRVIISVNKSLQLQTEVLPVDATDQTVVWSITNGNGQATVSESGLVTGISEGEVTVVATSNDGSGVFAELVIMIKLIDKIKIRNNRFELTVLVPDNLIPSKASLHSIHGSRIETRVVESNECIFDISSLPAGVYVVSVYNSTIQAAEKIVIGY
jgi:uncharacterized protein YjdB